MADKVAKEGGERRRANCDPRDLTERQRSEALFAGIVSIAADAIIAIDEQQRITLFNDGAERIFGYARAELLGQPLDVLLPERFRKTHAVHIRRFGSSEVTARQMGQRAEIYGRRKSGEEFPAEASISHMALGGEDIFAVVLRDITERKRAQELLAQSNAELEARVLARTRELSAEMQRREATHEQLVRTQRMEAFGQLTGGIAHDFNNLLTVITGNLELLEMRLKDEKNRVLLSRAYDAAQMGARLAARLLTFARRRQYDTARLNLNDQVNGMVDLLRRTVGEPISVETRCASDLWTVRADPSEIENAVLNLAINARDAMPKGGHLVIATANASVREPGNNLVSKLAAGDYVRLSVTDTGTGMTPDVLQHAFEPFFSTKQPGQGTGLGLSTIYGFAHELGGTAAIDSEVGRGTTVTVYIPRSDGPHITARQNGYGDFVPSAAGETVLVVEDNAEVRQVTTGRLIELGYRVIAAEDGPGALKQLSSAERIDIVFTDVVMAGGMSGFDVVQWVHANKPGMKTLVTSGFADDALRNQAGQFGHLKILRKPYSRGDLARAIRRALDS